MCLLTSHDALGSDHVDLHEGKGTSAWKPQATGKWQAVTSAAMAKAVSQI